MLKGKRVSLLELVYVGIKVFWEESYGCYRFGKGGIR